MARLAKSNQVRIIVVGLVLVNMVNFKPMLDRARCPANATSPSVSAPDFSANPLTVSGRVWRYAALPPKVLWTLLYQRNFGALPRTKDPIHDGGRCSNNLLAASNARDLDLKTRTDAHLDSVPRLIGTFAFLRAKRMRILCQLTGLSDYLGSAVQASRLTRISASPVNNLALAAVLRQALSGARNRFVLSDPARLEASGDFPADDAVDRSLFASTFRKAFEIAVIERTNLTWRFVDLAPATRTRDHRHNPIFASEPVCGNRSEVLA